MSQSRKPIVIVAGTRPELIKLAPVDRAFRRLGAPVQLWLTGQHSDLAEGPIAFFGLEPARRLRGLRPGQTSNALLGRLLARLDRAMAEADPAAVVVQGDTTSALAGGLAAFHRQIPVAHVEAGLRSGDLAAPFPEELNRRVVDVFARWCFPPTVGARLALLREGRAALPEPTGNTGIDALHWAVETTRRRSYWPAGAPPVPPGTRLILSTGHRRENLGAPLRRILGALAEEVGRRPGTMLLHIAHPNPAANEDARAALAGAERVHILPPASYPDFVALMDRAAAVVSDSGGVQEEAPSFGIPVLITREVTERPEVLQCGGRLIGTDPDLLRDGLDEALARDRRPSDALVPTPFGDGRASPRIAERVLADLGAGG